MVATPNFCHKLLRLYHQLQHKEMDVLYFKKQILIRARNIQTEYDPIIKISGGLEKRRIKTFNVHELQEWLNADWFVGNTNEFDIWGEYYECIFLAHDSVRTTLHDVMSHNTTVLRNNPLSQTQRSDFHSHLVPDSNPGTNTGTYHSFSHFLRL